MPGLQWQLAMVTFAQTNLHKSSQATILAGQELEGKTNVVSLITEPHLVYNKITGFPKRSKIVYDNSIPPNNLVLGRPS